jgi:hypothetical protein
MRSTRRETTGLCATRLSATLSIPERGVVKTTRERAEEKRQEKLELIREQVESGALLIRPMTAAERRLHPPRPRPPQRWTR